MDGASKFVKGDAIAAIVIVAHQPHRRLRGRHPAAAPCRSARRSRRYSLLTVGDGLVAQIPALLISLSSGLIVTRAATESDLGTDLLHQFTRHKRTLQLARRRDLRWSRSCPACRRSRSSSSAARCCCSRTRLPSDEEIARSGRGRRGVEAAPVELSPDSPEHLVGEMRVEPLELEIAYDLIDLVDAAKGGDLLDRVRALRRKLALELGVVIPLVRTRDNLELPPQHVRDPRARRRRRARRSAGRHVLVLGDDPGALPGHADARAGVRAPGHVGAARVPPPGRDHRRDRRRPRVGHHHPPRRGRAPQRGPAAQPPGREDAHRRREAERPGRDRRAERRQRHAPARSSVCCSCCSTKASASATSCASSKSSPSARRTTQGPRADRRGGAHRARPRDLGVAREGRQAPGAHARPARRARAAGDAAHRRHRHLPRARPADAPSSSRSRSPATPRPRR